LEIFRVVGGFQGCWRFSGLLEVFRVVRGFQVFSSRSPEERQGAGC
jgi:hypothetical protein